MDTLELKELHSLASVAKSFRSCSKIWEEQATECDNKKAEHPEWLRLASYYKGKQDAYISAAQAVEHLIDREIRKFITK